METDSANTKRKGNTKEDKVALLSEEMLLPKRRRLQLLLSVNQRLLPAKKKLFLLSLIIGTFDLSTANGKTTGSYQELGMRDKSNGVISDS